jgi:hypothetical protein
MKNLKILSLSFLLCFSLSIAAIAQTLTPEQLQEYNKQKLSLDLRGIGMGSYGANSISYSSWTKWSAYQGFNAISESKFYSIAGYEDLANLARKREKKGKTLMWTGFGLMGGGLIVMLASTGSEGITGITIGGATALVGIVVGYWSIGINSSNMKPYGVVTGIADEYNSQLCITIKKKF